MLAILAYWQHEIKMLSRTYRFLYWDIMFPIGMYTVCSYQLAKGDGLGLPDVAASLLDLCRLTGMAGYVLRHDPCRSEVRC